MEGTYLAYANKSQKPKIGLARISMTAKVMISVSTVLFLAPSPIARYLLLAWHPNLPASIYKSKLTGLDQIQRPQYHLIPCNPRKEIGDLPLFIQHRSPARQTKLMHHNQERHAGHRIPPPPLPLLSRIREEPAREHHRPVREQRDQDIAPIQPGE
jgi:hypothetical protein